ncbi:MAG TPA: hypothetical protein VK773_05370 [Acidimicrobiales bacterium]|jgi:hypothetical protein|nr:hypothetical protein [Acidimicrobiales bacterium]
MGRTRSDVHRIAAHVLGRRRYAVSGHFGLRASPGGIGTPAFGPEPETLRLTPACLVREVGGESHGLALGGSTLASLAAFAAADLDGDFSAGADMPAPGPADEPLELDGKELADLFSWFDLGWRVLDEVMAERTGECATATIQLWPEHFDVGTSLESGPDGVNLGFSPGDGFSDEAYVYVGPWSAARPGPSAYWNASFGAVLPRSQVHDAADAAAFIRTGLDRLGLT